LPLSAALGGFMAKTKPIRDALRTMFYPHVFSLGFDVDKRLQPEFVVFRRFAANKVHIFEIQWDKYHRPKFVINFAEAPLDGIEFGGKHMDTKDLSPVHCGTYRRLLRDQGKFSYRWFQLRRPLMEQVLLLSRNYDPDEIAAQVIQRFNEVEDWWANKVIGKHVQRY
jgi:hypothetical protein